MRDLEPHNYLALLVRRLLFLQEEIDRVLHWAVVAYSGSVEEARKINTSSEAVRDYLNQFDRPVDLAYILKGRLPETAPIEASEEHLHGWCMNVASGAFRLSEDMVTNALTLARLSQDLMRVSQCEH